MNEYKEMIQHMDAVIELYLKQKTVNTIILNRMYKIKTHLQKRFLENGLEEMGV